MKEFFDYIIIASVYMALSSIFYSMMLGRDTHYTRNRVFILASILLSLLIPFVRFNLPYGSGLSEVGNDLFRMIDAGEVFVTTEETSTAGIHITMVFFAIYITGCIVSMILLLSHLGGLKKLVKKYGRPGSRLVLTDNPEISGFSAMGYIFVGSNLDREELASITDHEQRHIDYNHFADLVFVKTVSVIFWFNPFVYLFERSLKAVHEYQVDEMMVHNTNNLLAYQQLIMNQLFRTHLFSFQSAFSGHTLIKKRMIMMTKKRSRKIAGIKLLLGLPLLALFILLFSCRGKEMPAETTVDQVKTAPETATEQIVTTPEAVTETETETAIFTVVEVMPTFQGGDISHFRDWVQRNVKYPEVAAKNGIQGKVFISFVVDTDGIVSDAEILRGVDPSLDNEAIRVVKSSPEWGAGKQNGKLVNVRMSITVNFQLQ